ncbi:MAG: DNA repair protein RecN [Actinomycetota bacterium]|nr:DNA repair protein RecN [Actinomycetota bacterium]
MLADLVVRGLGVIDATEVSFGAGSNALTGETGAGKTLVVAAVGLLLGDRADRVIVRRGRTAASAEGRFVIDSSHPAARRLVELGLAQETGSQVEVVVSRAVPADGSSSARINGHLVTAATMSEIGRALVEIAGQHEHGRISSPTWQRHALDSFVGEEAVAAAAEVAEAFRSFSKAATRLRELRAAEQSRERELDTLRHEISEIESASIREGEFDDILAETGRMEHAETLTRGMDEAVGSLRAEGGAEDMVARAATALRPLEPHDPKLTAVREQLERAGIELADAAAELTARMVAPDPTALEQARLRLDVLARLKRKYGQTEEQILTYLDRARAREAELEAAGGDVELLETRATEQEARARAAAVRLGRSRRAAAARLEAAVAEFLGELAMEGASFRVAVTEADLYEGGTETVEFLFAADPAEAARPLAKVASGGELSRIALVLHLLTSSNDATTLIFDEVDAGIGGAAAQSVGRALAALARESGRQVVVVTHLPQVAAFSDNHFRVLKEEVDGRAAARVQEVQKEDRVGELSRMLAGLPESERGREHARELLDIAGGAGAA